MQDAADRTREEGAARFKIDFRTNGKKIFHGTGVTRLDRKRTRLHFVYDTEFQGIEAGTGVTTLSVGEQLYVKQDGAENAWVHVPDDPAESGVGTSISESLAYMSAVTDDAHEEGGSRYSATVDLGRVAEHLPAAEREVFEQTLEKPGAPQEMDLTAELDDEGKIKKLQYQLGGGGQRIDVSLDLFDFGARGDYTPPKDFVEG